MSAHRVAALVFIMAAIIPGLATEAGEGKPQQEPAVLAKAQKNIDEGKVVVRELLQNLQKLGASPEEQSWQEEMIRLLGSMKAEEAVPELVKRISFLTMKPVDERTIQNVYPAVEALVHIGKPATVPLLKAVADCADNRKMNLYVYAIATIETRPVAVFLIKNRLKEAKDGKEKANLQAALEDPLIKE